MNAPAIVLIGPMGAGKSSVGRRLAKALDLPFYDSDSAVVAAHGPIETIFVERGEAAFRALEREAVRTGLAQGGVIALGGGAVLDPDTQAELARHRVVLLTVSQRTVSGRVNGTRRPLLQDADDDPLERWQKVYEARRALYERLADVVFDTSTGPLQDVVDRVAEWAGGATHE